MEDGCVRIQWRLEGVPAGVWEGHSTTPTGNQCGCAVRIRDGWHQSGWVLSCTQYFTLDCGAARAQGPTDAP
eukprot:m.105305 g.105305  ORF g.105305 m.105305 type:complete len:72 (+) comp12640_c1_seq3:312-527(+)